MSKKNPEQLTNIDKSAIKSTVATLLPARSARFVIAISRNLDNGFSFKDLKRNHLQSLHAFIKDTVGKGLSISDVEKLFLRRKGLPRTLMIDGIEFEEIHLGKDDNPFRLFGYYANDGYFHLTRIDLKHKTHKMG